MAFHPGQLPIYTLLNPVWIYSITKHFPRSIPKLIDYNGRMAGAIAVNARSIHAPQSGVGRYTREITRRLGERVRLLSTVRTAQGFRGHHWEQLILPLKLKSGEVLWSPANSGPIAVSRQVVTLHDISPLDQPAGFTYSFRTWYRILLPLLARRAKLLITDSEFSRNRIVRRLGVAPGKVEVVPCGVDHDHFYPRSDGEITAVREKYGLPTGYLLTVGALERRKNYERLFHAWERVLPYAEDNTLLVLGSSARPFRHLAFDHLPGRVQFIPSVEERDLPPLYSGALALVFPSLYEGFGLPALEAMACGTPVIVSNAGALPEVVSNAGRLVEPESVEDITQAIIRVITEAELREEYSSRGLSRSRDFSWELTAARILSVLESAGSES